MLYSIFMRKTKGDISPFDVSIVINNYIKSFMTSNDIVITFPGFMSTHPSTINNFLSKLRLPANTFFTVGMNGTFHLMGTKKTIQQAHNNRFRLKVCGLKNTNKDHAKMMFFLENIHPINNEISASQLLSLNVKAVLIGSSNQSNTTYFSSIADKGEADIFLMNGDFIGNNSSDILYTDRIVKNFYRNIREQFFNEEMQYKNNKTPMENIESRMALLKELEPTPTDFLNELFSKSLKDLIEF